MHWAPIDDDGLRARMHNIADWIERTRPSAVVVDVSVEVAMFVRLLGVPVIVVAMPGRRIDAPHEMVYHLADHILACWPNDLYDPEWLHAHRAKTSYIGGVSRFDGRKRIPRISGKRRIVFLGGAGASDVGLASVDTCATHFPQYRWHAVGVSTDTWVRDPWPTMSDADVIVAHAGESSIADLATAARPSIIIPQPRPFEEQFTTAHVLAENGLAVSHPRWPTTGEWPDLIDRARRTDLRRWRRWRTEGAARRAASAIEDVAGRRVRTPAAS